jgi:hypothetical protein
MGSSEKFIDLWKDRKVQVEETGNCLNPIRGPFFSTNMKKEEMLAYCDKMIEALKDENQRI